jgi:hypothetical protein
MGKTEFSILDGALGSPCNCGVGCAPQIPLTNDGEFGHIIPGG